MVNLFLVTATSAAFSNGLWDLRSAAIGGLVGALVAFSLDRLSRWLTARQVRWVAFDRFPAQTGHVSSLANVGDADAFEVRVEGIDCHAGLIAEAPRVREGRGDGTGPTTPVVARIASGAIVGVLATGGDPDVRRVRVTWVNGAIRWHRFAKKAQTVIIGGDSGTESPRV